MASWTTSGKRTSSVPLRSLRQYAMYTTTTRPLSSNATEQYFKPQIFHPHLKGGGKKCPMSHELCEIVRFFPRPYKLLLRMPAYTIELVSIVAEVRSSARGPPSSQKVVRSNKHHLHTSNAGTS